MDERCCGSCARGDRRPRPSRRRLRDGRGRRAGGAAPGRADLAGRAARRPEGLAGHGRLAQVPRRASAPRPRVATGRSGSTVEPPPGPTETADDTLQLYFLCAHPSLTPASAVALTLRAVGGLTTRQIAQAYLVPEATMAQRISRAKRTVRDVRLDQPGDLGDRAAGALPGLQRGVHRRRRPGRRGDPADPAAGGR